MGVVLEGNITVKVGTKFTFVLSGSVERVYSKPIFSHSCVLTINLIPVKAGCVTHRWPVRWKGHLAVGSYPGCMNEGKTHFTFLSIYIRESGYFMVMFFMARVWMVVLFIARAVDAWVCFHWEQGVLWAKVWVQISLDPVEVGSCNLGQICSISGAMNECIAASVHTLNSAYNEVTFNKKLPITKQYLCTKYTYSPINKSPLTKSCL